MALEVQMAIAWGMIFVLLAILGLALILLGQFVKNRAFRSWGLVILGLVVFIAPMFYYLDRVGDDWNFTLTAGDIVIFGTLSFLGGMAVILGVMGARKPQRT